MIGRVYQQPSIAAQHGGAGAVRFAKSKNQHWKRATIVYFSASRDFICSLRTVQGIALPALPCIIKGQVNPYPTVRPIAKCQVFLIIFNKPARLRHDVQPLSGLAREGSCSVLVAHTSVLRRRCHTSALSSAAILMNISLFRRASLLR
jgi:hypothetical protein